MDEQQRAAVLEDLAEDADRRRQAFLEEAGRQFASFVDANRDRLRDLGGLVLIDDDADYLSVDADGTFRSRTRFQDESGEWVSESEQVEQAAELVELFDPSDLFAAFADAAREEAGGEDVEGPAGEGPDEEADVEAEEAEEAALGRVSDDEWIASLPTPRDKPHAARLLYDLALTYQERSQLDQAQLLDDFQDASASVAEVLGDSRVVDDEDERIWFRATGAFEGEVVPELDDEAGGAAEPEWLALTTPDQLVQFYDPTDLFGDLAEAIAEAYPEVAPELDEDGEDGEAAADDAAPADDAGGDRQQA